MRSRTTNKLALLISMIVAACVPGDEALEFFEEYADSHSTTDEGPEDSDGARPATTGADDDSLTSGDASDPSDDMDPGVDTPPEILEFTIDPPLIDEAGPVNIHATLSASVTKALLFEKRDGATAVLAVLEPAGELDHEYAVTSDALNGAHEVYLQAFDDDDRVVQAVETFEVALPPGGTPVWHQVDYEPDDAAVFAYGSDVAVHDDGIVVVGVRYEAMKLRLVARRYTASGDLDWTYETDDQVTGLGVAADAEGDVIVVGIEHGPISRMWVHKLDQNGVPVWNEPGRGAPHTAGHDVAVAEDGQIFVAGTRTAHEPDIEFVEKDAMVWEFGPGGDMEGWAIYDNNQDHEWGDDTAEGVAILPDGRVLLAGHTTGKDGNDEAIERTLVLEYTQHELIQRWVPPLVELNASAAHAISADLQGGIVLAGWTRESPFDSTRIEVRHLDAAYSSTWLYPGLPVNNPQGFAYAVARDPEGRFAVAASIEDLGTFDAQVFIARDNGSPAWFPPFSYTGNDGGNDHVYGVTVDRFGYVYFTGSESVDGASRLLVGKLRP